MSKVAWLGLLSLRVYKRFGFLVTLQGFVPTAGIVPTTCRLGGLVHSFTESLDQPASTHLTAISEVKFKKFIHISTYGQKS